MKKKLNIILLSGGSGTRFAPLSTQELPKQFLNIFNSNHTMIQETYARVAELMSPTQCYVSTNSSYVELVQNQLAQIPFKNIIAEPFKKNTAPAIALISYLLFKKDPHAVLLFLPSDHYIHDNDKAREIFKKSFACAATHEVLVTFGVPPEFPSSEYGYILFDASVEAVNKVIKFVEKPDIETAKKYIAQVCYYWNSGMFVWQAKVLLAAVEKYLPKMFELLINIFQTEDDFYMEEKIKKYFEEVESISIDYGVMEKAENVVMIPFDAGWSDVGTWKGLSELVKRHQLKIPEEVNKYLGQYEAGILK